MHQQEIVIVPFADTKHGMAKCLELLQFKKNARIIALTAQLGNVENLRSVMGGTTPYFMTTECNFNSKLSRRTAILWIFENFTHVNDVVEFEDIKSLEEYEQFKRELTTHMKKLPSQQSLLLQCRKPECRCFPLSIANWCALFECLQANKLLTEKWIQLRIVYF